MRKAILGNIIPISVSFAALIVATSVGLIPIWQQNNQDSSQVASTTIAMVDLATLDERLAALESNSGAGTSQSNGIDPVLRDEINLIIKGLVNQTGRVSRLQDEVASLNEIAGKTPPRVSDEISLAKRGLANLTRRANLFQDALDLLGATPANVDRLTLQMSNVERAITQMNIRQQLMNETAEGLAEIQSTYELVSAAPTNIDRLDLQMSNVERAITQMNLRQQIMNETAEGLKEIQGTYELVSSAPSNIDRLALQMSNVERAITQMNLRLVEMKNASTISLAQEVTNIPATPVPTTPVPTGTAAVMIAIQETLDLLRSAPPNIDRLTLQMSNVERAITRMNQRLYEMEISSSNMSEQPTESAQTEFTANKAAEELSQINEQLQTLLEAFNSN